jgi:replicative DNA helicase
VEFDKKAGAFERSTKLIIAKQRNGETGTVDLAFAPESVSFAAPF